MRRPINFSLRISARGYVLMYLMCLCAQLCDSQQTQHYRSLHSGYDITDPYQTSSLNDRRATIDLPALQNEQVAVASLWQGEKQLIYQDPRKTTFFLPVYIYTGETVTFSIRWLPKDVTIIPFKEKDLGRTSLASTNPSILRSSDGGHTWKALKEGLVDIYYISHAHFRGREITQTGYLPVHVFARATHVTHKKK